MSELDWEREHYNSGIDAFLYREEAARAGGRMTETHVGSSILNQRILDLADRIEQDMAGPSRGIGGAYKNAVKVAATRWDDKAGEFTQDYRIVAYIGLFTILNMIYSGKERTSRLAAISVEIGRRLELDQQLYIFKKDNPAFVGKIEASLDEQNVTSLEHRVKTWQKKWRQAEMRWTEWGTVKRAQVGLRVIRAALRALDDMFFLTKRHNGKNLVYVLDTSVELDDFILDQSNFIAERMPERPPLLQPPVNWRLVDGEVVGGYHSPELRRATPFIKTRSDEHAAWVKSNIPFQHIRAVNSIQAVEWKVNKPVLEALKHYLRANTQLGDIPRHDKYEIPPHPGEDASEEQVEQWKIDAKRVHGKNKQNANDLIVLSKTILMADKLGDRGFYHVAYPDFRGRIYCASPLLSPQGPDYIRGLLKFGKPKRLGERGLWWTAINGANKYGYDKHSYPARVRWVLDNRQSIEEVVRDQYSARSRAFLESADKPFQFIAFCHEWAATGYGTNPDAEGYLPCGLDGSCNGLQHYAALLRDPVGGAATNVVYGHSSKQRGAPADVYTDVARVFSGLVLGSPGASAKLRNLAEDDDKRKLAKRPVMTLPYGSTQMSCRGYIREYINDNAEKCDLVDQTAEQWKLAVEATPYMWQAIGQVVVAAREGMDWLQRCASMVSKAGHMVHYRSAVEFPVYFPYAEWEDIRINATLLKPVKISLREPGSKSDVFRHRLAVAPNFVHSLDSSHAVMTVNAGTERGMTEWMMVHDDFATYAADADELNEVIRQTFVRMYQTDWLQVWKLEMERLAGIDLPDPPTPGDMDIMDVLDSPYFFG